MLTGAKWRETFGDCLDVGVWPEDAGAGDSASDDAESKEEVAAW